MPSPIAHVSAACVLFAAFRRFLPRKALIHTGRGIGLLGLCLFFSTLPDVDSIMGFITRDLGRYHNQWTHSLFTGFAICLAFALAMRIWKHSGFATWLGISCAGYALHVVMDFFTYGRGVKLFWPLTDSRYKFEPPLFRGLRWSEGLFSIEHLWTALQEIMISALLIAAYFAFESLYTKFRHRGDKLT